MKVCNLVCANCGKQFKWTGAGRCPEYCSEVCKRAAARRNRRGRYVDASMRDALISTAQEYYSRDPEADPEAPSAHMGVTVHEAAVDESGAEWTVSRADAGLRKPKGKRSRDEGSRKADADKRYPLAKSWADKGADLDIEKIRRKDRELYGGPVGAWNHGPIPVSPPRGVFVDKVGGWWKLERGLPDGKARFTPVPHWIPAGEWLAALPDDGEGYINGIPVDPFTTLAIKGF